ncbi:MAG: amino acid ABC transporter permease [Thermodesulfobacteriota bacterium]
MNLPFQRKNRPGILDAVVLMIVLAAVGLFLHRMVRVIQYQWEWGAIPSYFFRFDARTGVLRPNMLTQGFITTVKLSVWSMVMAFAIGSLCGVMRSRGGRFQRFVGWLYVNTVRNIPSLVLVFIFYFFISSQLFDTLDLDARLRESPALLRDLMEWLFTAEERINMFFSAVITLALYEGAYVTEIIRGGLSGIPREQWDAAYSLGLTPVQTFLRVIFPQTLRRVFSPLGGQFISTIKDSAIVSVISVQELTFQGMELMSATYLTFEIWITITLLYFGLTFSLSRFMAFLERRYVRFP